MTSATARLESREPLLRFWFSYYILWSFGALVLKAFVLKGLPFSWLLLPGLPLCGLAAELSRRARSLRTTWTLEEDGLRLRLDAKQASLSGEAFLPWGSFRCKERLRLRGVELIDARVVDGWAMGPAALQMLRQEIKHGEDSGWPQLVFRGPANAAFYAALKGSLGQRQGAEAAPLSFKGPQWPLYAGALALVLCAVGMIPLFVKPGQRPGFALFAGQALLIGGIFYFLNKLFWRFSMASTLHAEHLELSVPSTQGTLKLYVPYERMVLPLKPLPGGIGLNLRDKEGLSSSLPPDKVQAAFAPAFAIGKSHGVYLWFSEHHLNGRMDEFCSALESAAAKIGSK